MQSLSVPLPHQFGQLRCAALPARPGPPPQQHSQAAPRVQVKPFYPASYATASDNIISVAASLPSDNLTSFSNWGATSVDLGERGGPALADLA